MTYNTVNCAQDHPLYLENGIFGKQIDSKQILENDH